MAATPQEKQNCDVYTLCAIHHDLELATTLLALLHMALRRGMGDVAAAEVRQEFQARQKAGEFRSVESPKYASAGRFTTPETIAQERANIKPCSPGQKHRFFHHDRSQCRGTSELTRLPKRFPAPCGGRHSHLTGPVHGLQGFAGTGKTTTLETIREGAEKSGYKVEGFAPTSKASGQLRDAGIEANTLQSFLQRKTVADPDARHLYLLDESSLASSKQMRQFLDKVGPNDHIVVIGDVRQHQGVEAGRPFQQMQDAGMRTAQLDQIVRQKDPELLRAVEHLARNETERGVALLREQGRVTEIPNRAGTHPGHRPRLCDQAGKHDHRLSRQQKPTAVERGRAR